MVAMTQPRLGTQQQTRLRRGAGNRNGGKTTTMPLLVRVMLVLVVGYVSTMVYLTASLARSSSQPRIGKSGDTQSLDKSGTTTKMETPSTQNNGDSDTENKSSSQKKKKQQQPPKQQQHPKQSGYYENKSFRFRLHAAEGFLKKYGADPLYKPITAYTEPPMEGVTVPGTGSIGDPAKDEDPGIPPTNVHPLPLRETTPDDLRKLEYPAFRSCHTDLPNKLPVDWGMRFHPDTGERIVWNTGNTETPPDFPEQEAPFCPVEVDPFLPWIHDIFPAVDGTLIEVVAQNKRRCRTGKKYAKDLKRLLPQASLMQPVSVERISQGDAERLAPTLWTSDNGTSEASTTPADLPRYRLAPFSESSDDGMYTRFICRFYGTDFTQPHKAESVLVGETLSVYPFNYEFVSYRKFKPTLVTPKGKDNKFFWASVLRFQCPVPQSLQGMVRSGETVLSDGTPTLRLEIVPIRTPPRFGVKQSYFSEDLAGPSKDWDVSPDPWPQLHNTTGFDPVLNWGDRNVLPAVEASGRWSNLPICKPPPEPITDPVLQQEPQPDKTITKKKHLLSACLWASASFHTRGKNTRGTPISDTSRRLREWIEFHLMVGFDHIYIYDNSAAHSNTTSLEPLLSQFSPSQVTRIDWPSTVCNNNIPAHDNTGERSSQYAAENSCRTRHAPFTEWIASFDADEYLVPMGDHQSLRTVLMAKPMKQTNILAFRSTRAKLKFEESM